MPATAADDAGQVPRKEKVCVARALSQPDFSAVAFFCRAWGDMCKSQDRRVVSHRLESPSARPPWKVTVSSDNASGRRRGRRQYIIVMNKGAGSLDYAAQILLLKTPPNANFLMCS